MGFVSEWHSKLVEDNMRLSAVLLILSYLFKFKLIFVRELVMFEKWYQEASHTLNVCREVLKTSGFALGFQHFFKPPDGNIPEYSPLVIKFKLIFVPELVLFEKWYEEASHTINVCREVLKTSGFALGFQHFFKPPDGNIPEYSQFPKA